jgi:hypothetical protein
MIDFTSSNHGDWSPGGLDGSMGPVNGVAPAEGAESPNKPMIRPNKYMKRVTTITKITLAIDNNIYRIYLKVVNKPIE